MTVKVFEKGRSVKYLQQYDLFRQYLSTYQSILDPEKCSIDFKIHELEVSEVPSRPIWHYDGTNSAESDPVARYALALFGDAFSATRFFLDEPSLFSGTEREIHLIAKKLEDEGREVKYLPFDSWTAYTSRNLHAASPSKTKGTRVLIRLREVT